MGGADLGRCFAAGAQFCGPLPKRLESALLFDGHELAVGDEPVLVGTDKVIEIGRLVGSKALGGAVENLTAAAKDSTVVNIAGVGSRYTPSISRCSRYPVSISSAKSIKLGLPARAEND